MSFCHETICGIAKYRLFLQASFILNLLQILLKTFSFCLTKTNRPEFSFVYTLFSEYTGQHSRGDWWPLLLGDYEISVITDHFNASELTSIRFRLLSSSSKFSICSMSPRSSLFSSVSRVSFFKLPILEKKLNCFYPLTSKTLFTIMRKHKLQ